jgi:hypothetical protein
VYARVAMSPGGSAVTGEASAPTGATHRLELVHRGGDGVLSIALFDDEETALRAGRGEIYAVATQHLRSDREARCARVSMHEGDPMRDVSPAPLVGLDGLAGAMMLIDRRCGKGIGILLFDSNDALQRGHAYVSESAPGTAGPATQIELYDVALLT